MVEVDLEKFFDRVNHDILMGLVSKRVEDKRILKLIRGYLNSGALEGGLASPTVTECRRAARFRLCCQTLCLMLLTRSLRGWGAGLCVTPVTAISMCGHGERGSRFKRRVRELTRCVKGVSLDGLIKELSRYITGWRGYFGHCETLGTLGKVDKWIKRRIRAIVWRQWMISMSPALSIALPNASLARLGLVSVLPDSEA